MTKKLSLSTCVCQSKICPYPPHPPSPYAINVERKDVGWGFNFSDVNGKVKYFFKSLDDLLIRIQTWEFGPTKTHQGFTSWTKLAGTTKRAVFYCTGLKPCFKAAAQVMSMRSMSTTPTSWCVHRSKACTNAPAWHACTTPLGIVIYKNQVNL